MLKLLFWTHEISKQYVIAIETELILTEIVNISNTIHTPVNIENTNVK